MVRTALPGFPVRTRYALTPAVRALRPLLVSLDDVGVALRDLGAGPPAGTTG